MSQRESTIKLILLGVERGVGAAVAKAEAGIRSLGDESVRTSKDVDKSSASLKKLGKASESLGTAGKWAGLFGAAIGAGGAAVGAALPALGALSLQFGIAKAAIGGSTEALDAYDKALKDGKGDFTEYNRLLKSMTPEQRAFTEAVVATKKPLSDLQKTAGRSFLPGVTKFLNDSQSLFPVLDHAVARTGKIMGDTASQLGDLFKSEDFQQSLEDMLRSSDLVTKAIGDSFVKLTGKVVEFGGNMAPAAEGFATFIGDLESGVEGFLDGLAPHAADFKSIWESLGSVMHDVLPILGQLAGELSGQLAPILQDVAGWIREHKDAISEWVPWIANAVVALAGFKLALAGVKAVNAVGELLSIGGAILGVGDKAKGAEGKVGGFSGKLGLLKGIGAAAALYGVVGAMDAVNASSESGNLSGWNGELHDIWRIMTGDWGDPFADINRQLDEMGAKWAAGQAPVQQWAQSVGQAATTAGTAIQNFFRGLVGLPPLPPINIDANTDPATGKVNDWVGGVSRARGTAALDANPADANNALGGWVGSASATTGLAHLNAEPGRANGVLGGWVGSAGGTTGTAHLSAEPGRADGVVTGWKGAADRTTGQAHLSAEASVASRVAQGFYNSWAGRVITMSIHAITSVFGATGGAVTGGLIVPGFAPGGAVRGAGSGTSDNVPAMLSNGEWVMTAEQVRKAGGFGGMQAIASALNGNGPSPMASSARAAMRTPTASSNGSSSSSVEVRFVGNTSDALATVIMQLQRTGKIQLKAA